MTTDNRSPGKKTRLWLAVTGWSVQLKSAVAIQKDASDRAKK